MVAAGFQEGSPDGRALAAQVREFCLQHRIGLVGPNCYGFSNFYTRALVTRNDVEGVRAPGPIAMTFQSGGLCLGACQLAYAHGIDIGFAISSGNELVVDTNDYFLDHPEVRVLGGSLERIPDPDRFAGIATRARDPGKPIVLLKLGRSEASRRLAVAHTGSVAGSDAVVDTFLRDLGVIRVDSLDELVTTAGLLATAGIHWGPGHRSSPSPAERADCSPIRPAPPASTCPR